MNSKMNTLTALALVCLAKSVVSAEPPDAPLIYTNGPQVSSINLSAAEMAAYALYESAMQVAESIILASSCNKVAGSYSLSVIADGGLESLGFNQINVISPGGLEGFVLNANLLVPDDSRGQLLSIEQVGNGSLNENQVNGYMSQVAFNQLGTMMDSSSRLQVKGANGKFDSFQGKVIKDFYLETDPNTNIPYILDWGLQDISKLNYPVNKYWQRSKSVRNDGIGGHTVFVKERLTGSTACRIVLESKGTNSQGIFIQDGTLTISTEKPSDPISAFDAF